MSEILFHRPWLEGNELHYLEKALLSGRLCGDGPFTRKCQSLLEAELGVAKVLLTTSCTQALEMTACLLEIQPGDEVISPAFTFVSTVNAFALRGARPVFMDIRPDTLNLDESKLESAITDRTRAIVVVHYAGVSCEMDRILEIAGRHDIPVVEDNALGLFGKYRGRPLGSFGCMAAQSFHETKNLTCGEGGALLVNDGRYQKRAEVFREKGTNRGAFLRGDVAHYTWVDLGSSCLLSELLAAVLYAQLEASESMQTVRERMWHFYQSELREWAATMGAGLPFVPGHCQPSFPLFYLVMQSLEQRERLREHLRCQGIQSAFHYQPLHLSEMGQRYGGTRGDCPVTEQISARLLRLPFHHFLTEEDQGRVTAAVRTFTGNEEKSPDSTWVSTPSLS